MLEPAVWAPRHPPLWHRALSPALRGAGTARQLSGEGVPSLGAGWAPGSQAGAGMAACPSSFAPGRPWCARETAGGQWRVASRPGRASKAKEVWAEARGVRAMREGLPLPQFPAHQPAPAEKRPEAAQTRPRPASWGHQLPRCWPGGQWPRWQRGRPPVGPAL